MRLNFFDRLWRLIFGSDGAAPAPAKPPTPSPSPIPDPTLPDEVRALLLAHNDIRIAQGVRALWINPLLAEVAQAHSIDQASHNNMSHTGSDGSSPFDRLRKAGYKYTSAGENVAMGYTTVAAVMKGWMNSSGHRANILRNYVEVGFGVATDNFGRMYWTALFATPAGGTFLSSAMSESCPEGLTDPALTEEYLPKLAEGAAETPQHGTGG